MPGIVGLLTRMPRERAQPQLLRMVEALRHEDFYVTGTWEDEALGVYVGWIARKGSFCDGMPLRNEQGDVALVFSGEEFSDPRSARHPDERRNRVDAGEPSYLADLYEANASFPAELNGRFHGLVIDRRRGTTTLFNDRYGMHRLYHHESKDAFYFAAEAKAILAVRPELRRIDPRGVGEFVACGCTLEGRSLFQDLHVLPPGAKWVFRDGSIAHRGTYFEPREWENQSPLEPESFYREIRDVFSRSLPRYFGGRERIAMSLTGGLDTRMIMAWHPSRPGSLPCYTFGGMFRDCQDVVVAREVARACQQPHEVIRVGQDFLARFPRYAQRTVYLTDGCVDVGRAPDLYINETAREIAPVRMTGNYGGEILRRVRAFKPEAPVPGLFQPEFLAHVREAAETYTGLLRGHPLSFAAFKQGHWHQHGGLENAETQVTLRSPYLETDFVQTVFRAPTAAVANNAMCLRLIADGDIALRRIRTDRGVGGARGPLSAAASSGVLDFLFKAEYAYDLGMPQWAARIDRLLSPLRLERLFLGRHKLYHFRVWYRDVLARYVADMLLDRRALSRPYVEPKRLEAVVQGHLEGKRNYTEEIHKLLTLELVHRLFIDPT